MRHCTQSLLFLLGWNLLCCDGTVSVSLINSANGVDTLECGSDVGIVSCRINPYFGILIWQLGGTIIPLASCSPFGCVKNQNTRRNYSHTFDVENGIFNLTLDGVTFDDNRTLFICEDGSLFDSITIEVVPAYSENNTNMYETDEGKQVEFTTACVQPGVEFDWFTVKTDNSDRKTYNNGQNEMTETTECSLNLACGGVGTGKVSSKIIIPTVSDGEERYLEVFVKYKNPDEQRTFRFDEIFYFKDEGSGLPMLLKCEVLIIVIVGLLGVPLLICVVLYLKLMKRNQANLTMFNNNRNKGPREMPLHENKMSEMQTSAAGNVKRACQGHSQNKDGKAFYDTSGKRGLLLILQLEDTDDWREGNKSDLNVLKEFFERTLGFVVKSYNTYSKLGRQLNRLSSTDAEKYYCLMICISGHGNEKGVTIKTEWTTNEDGTEKPVFRWKTIDEIKKRFSNEAISTLSGVPKIIILDTCRGGEDNWTVSSNRRLMIQHIEPIMSILPTTDSDLLLINATTHGHVSKILDEGSVGIQGVMKALNANWKNDHLEEMLIDAREEVAEFMSYDKEKKIVVRQTLEIQTTLTKRLMFVKYEQKKQEVSPAE